MPTFAAALGQTTPQRRENGMKYKISWVEHNGLRHCEVMDYVPGSEMQRMLEKCEAKSFTVDVESYEE